MHVTEQFVAVVQAPGGLDALDEAALLIAAHARSGLDVLAERERLDGLAAGVGTPTLGGLRAHLFDELGFAGDVADYYDPRNSFLDQVLDRRVGIPVTLSVLLLEVGRRIGVALDAVSMPGHFLVGDRTDPEVFVDPFAGGVILDRRGAMSRFRRSHGPDVPFHAEFLDPVPPAAVIARMLANLDAIATARADHAMLEWVVQLRAAIPGAPASMHRRYASVLAARGRLDDAADLLERLGTSLAGSGLDDLAGARRLRARLN